MGVVKYAEFRGTFPAREDRAMPEGGAVVSHNTRLENGKIRAAMNNEYIQDSDIGVPALTIHRYINDAHWMEWSVPAEVVRRPIPNDTWGRLLFTQQGVAPRYVDNDTGFTGAGPYPTVSYPLGVEAPTDAPSLTLNGTATDPDDLADTRYYLWTIVDKFGQEGPPGPASTSVDWRAGQTVEVGNIPGTPLGSHQYTHCRLYRTSGTADAGYQLVFDNVAFDDVGTATVTDNVAAGALGEQLATAEFEPPVSTMRFLAEHPAGFLVGAYSNVVACSEPGYTYAWPPRYEYHVPATVVALVPAGDAVFVLTDGQPYALVGQHPGSLARQELPITYACVSGRAAAVVDGAIIYPSKVGLIRVDGGGGSIATLGIFDRDQWQDFDTSTMIGCRWGDRYMFVATRQSDSVRQAYVLDPAYPEGGVETLACTADAIWEDRAGGKVFIAQDSKIYEWCGAATKRIYTYRTNSSKFPAPTAPAAITASGPQGIGTTVIRDGVAYYQTVLYDLEAEPLPADQEAVRYALEFEGDEDVYDATLAEALWELDQP